MAELFWLSDAQWQAIQPLLPRNQPGARRVDDRRVISGILHVLRTGGRWCDCPADYGPATTVYNRFNRWSRRAFWPELLAVLAQNDAASAETLGISTYRKAQRVACLRRKRLVSTAEMGVLRAKRPAMRKLLAALTTLVTTCLDSL